MHHLLPSDSSSERALELALKDVFATATGNPSSSPILRASLSLSPQKEISGCVKQAAGTELWLRIFSRP